MNPSDVSVTFLAPTPFYTEGGASTRILAEVRGLRSLGVGVRVFTYPSGRDWPGIETLRPRRSSRVMGIGFHPLRPQYDLELLRLMLTRGIRPDEVLHVFLHEGACLGYLHRKLTGRPFVLDLQGSLSEELGRTFRFVQSRLGGTIIRRLEGALERSAAQVIVSSPGMYRILQSRGHVPLDRLHLIADGVALEDFPLGRDRDQDRRGRWRAKLGFSESDVIAIYAGGLSPEQGIDDVIALAPRMIEYCPRLRFLLYGTPTQLHNLREYATKVRRSGLEERIKMPGPIHYELLPEALNGADIALTWKHGPEEEANGKIPAYMAAGLPTVTLRLPVSEYYLGREGERGGVIADTASLAADAVVALANDPTRRTSLGRKARATAEERLSLTSVGRQILEVYERLETPSNPKT